jgi:hypothetical protein
MQDKTTKWLLGAIALGLFLNAGAVLYQAVVPVAHAGETGEVYIKGGKLDVKVTDGDMEITGKVTAKQDTYEKLDVVVHPGGTIDVCNKCD